MNEHEIETKTRILGMGEQIRLFFLTIASPFSAIRFVDVLDIVLVSTLLFYIFLFIRERRAGKLAAGVIALLVGLFVSDFLEMKALHFIISSIVQVGFLALFIIFQPELRSILEKVGGNSIKGFGRLADTKSQMESIEKTVDAISVAAGDLSASHTGALIVIEQSTKLGDEIKTGVPIDALVNSFLIRNIFYDKAPLHDGAMIIRGDRIVACGCFLPLSTDPDIMQERGTRHRAALGMSENCDAVVVVVSEENGVISIAKEGHLLRNFDKYSLKDYLLTHLMNNASTNQPLTKRKIFKRK